MDIKAKEKLENFIDLEKHSSLISYYVYPLTGAVSNDFGRWGNMKEILIDKENKAVLINISKDNSAITQTLESLDTYRYSVVVNGKKFRVYDIQNKFLEDFSKVLEGKYTEMTSEAKEHICTSTSLQYNKKKGMFYNTSSILQALYTDSPLRGVLAEYLGIPIAELPMELVSKIPGDSKIYLNNYVKEGA